MDTCLHFVIFINTRHCHFSVPLQRRVKKLLSLRLREDRPHSPQETFKQDDTIRLNKNFRQLHSANEAGTHPPRQVACVFPPDYARGVPAWSKFHTHSAAYLFFHRSRNMYTDEAEHRESVDAEIRRGLCNKRDSIARILIVHYVPYTFWKGWFEHHIGDWRNACDTANRCT